MSGAAAASAATIDGDLRIATDTVLSEDTTVSGSIIVHPDATLNLNGHDLTAGGIRGAEIYEDGSGVKYERLDYIESDGTQYIITDFTPAAGDRAEVQIAFTEDGGNYSGIISTRDKNGNNNFNIFRTGSNGGRADLAFAIRADFGTYDGERMLTNLGDKMKVSAGIRRIVMHTGWPGSGKYHVSVRDENGTSVANNDALPVGSYSPAGPLVLMTAGKWTAPDTFTPGDGKSATAFNSKLRFYWLKFDGDGAKCTIYPVRRVSDGAIGAFNTVTKKFLPPATGTFTKFGEYSAGGTIVDTFTQGTRDLTVADASRVASSSTGFDGYSGATLFNNNYDRNIGTDWVNQRIIARTDNFPLRVDYDFGEGTPQVVDAYKIYSQQVDSYYRNRAPKAWKFYGSNDPAAKGSADDTLWVELDSRSSEVDWGCPEARVYSFRNETAYRYYRIKFTETVRSTTYHNSPASDSVLEIIQLEYFRTGRLCIDVPQGAAATNSAVTLSGDLLVVKKGAGTLNMAKENAGFGGERRLSLLVKEGYAVKTGSAPCGASGSLIQVEEGGQFDLNGDSYGYYDYDIAGSGPAGAAVLGALVNNTAVVNAWDHKRFMRNITLSGDATIGGSQNIGMSYGNAASWVYLNGHALTYDMADGVMVYASKIGHAGPGEVAIAGGHFRPTMENYPVSGDVSIRVLSGGVYDAQDKCPTQPLKDYIYEADGEYLHAASWNNYGNLGYTVVTNRYRPNTVVHADSGEPHPKVQLGAEGGLSPVFDLSLQTGTFDGGTTKFYAGSAVTVYTGSRELAAGDKLVSWNCVPDFYTPDASVTFVLQCDGASAEERHLEVDSRSDGLYLKDTRAPAYAIYNITEEDWTFYLEDGTPYQGEWQGITPDVEVRFSSFAEYEAIKALGVSPSGFRMTAFELPQGAEPAVFDMSSGMDFTVSEGLSIDLKGNTLKLPNALVGGSAAFTVTDTTQNGGTFVIDVPSGQTLRNANVAISGSVHVLKTGEGTFEADKTGQTYTGGTEATEGLLRCVRWGSDHHPFGANNSEITISTNGSLRASMDMNGFGDYHNYKFVLNGGHIYNSSSPNNPAGTILLANLRLTADSTMAMTNYGFIGNGFGPTEIELGGHRLTVAIGGDMYLYNTTIRNGEFNVSSGGFIHTARGTLKATDVSMRLNCAFRMESDMNVRDYESLYPDGWNRNDGKMRVYGTFTPTTDYFWGCEMQNGSKIDLSGKSGPWSTHNLTGSSMGGVRDVTFATGKTTIMINPAAAWVKALAKSKGKLVDWSAGVAPGSGVEFALDAGGDTRYKIRRSADGKGLDLYLTPGFAVIVK